MDLRDAINDTSGTAQDTLSKALVRAEEQDWRGVIVLALAGDSGARFMASSALNDMEMSGLLRWGTLQADERLLEDNTEPEEGV